MSPITAEDAKNAGWKIYDRLRGQGRSQDDAIRDAERWVKGNYGLEIELLDKIITSSWLPCIFCQNPSKTSVCEVCSLRLETAAKTVVDEILRKKAAAKEQKTARSIRKCDQCGQPWPFEDDCEDCRNKRWAEEKKARRPKAKGDDWMPLKFFICESCISRTSSRSKNRTTLCPDCFKWDSNRGI